MQVGKAAGELSFKLLSSEYTWVGAVLILAGILMHCLIVMVLYAEHPDYVPPKEKVSLKAGFREISFQSLKKTCLNLN